MTWLQTARLVLRPFDSGDHPAYAAIRAQPAVARFLPGGTEAIPDADRTADRLIAEFTAHWRDRGYGPWAALDRHGGRLIGHLGLRWTAELGDVEILYALDGASQGRGLATEGALAARDFAFERLALDAIVAVALPENLASHRVMEKAGLSFTGATTFKGHEVVRYRLTRADWAARPDRGDSYQIVGAR